MKCRYENHKIQTPLSYARLQRILNVNYIVVTPRRRVSKIDFKIMAAF